ncbi:MAG: PEP-CTERM sorting domain-containing protein [candidate division Zixibacteria bacterium]|nr:PEP-CTERM sorting domain-containing protein [candidate division Zixibacteria bacterium]
MILSRMFQIGCLLGFLIIFPITVFGVVSTQTIDPIKANNIRPVSYYIDITTQSWQKNTNESSQNTQNLFINDFGVINQINPSNNGISSDDPFDPNYGGLNNNPDERSTVSTVPEPSTILLFGIGSLGLAALRKRRK